MAYRELTQKEDRGNWVRAGGYMAHGDKKDFSLLAESFLPSVFSVHQGAVNQPTLHVGLQEMFYEKGGWVNLGDNFIQLFQHL